MAFTNDTRSSSTLTADTRNAAGSFTNDSQNLTRFTWGSDLLTWAAETHTWVQLSGSALSLDTRN